MGIKSRNVFGSPSYFSFRSGCAARTAERRRTVLAGSFQLTPGMFAVLMIDFCRKKMMSASCRMQVTWCNESWLETDWEGSWLGLSELCRSRRTESSVVYLDKFWKKELQMVDFKSESQISCCVERWRRSGLDSLGIESLKISCTRDDSREVIVLGRKILDYCWGVEVKKFERSSRCRGGWCLEREKIAKPLFKLERVSRSRIEQQRNESNEHDGDDLNARANDENWEIYFGFEVAVVGMISFSFDVLRR